MSDIGNKFVIGKIGFELFGFDINDVTSVVEMKKITRVQRKRSSRYESQKKIGISV